MKPDHYIQTQSALLLLLLLLLLMMMMVSELEEIPEDLKYCSNLQVLDITGNPLQK